jgi:nitroreductase
MELSDVMRTTGAAREFRPDPVEAGEIRAVLDDARFAPSGGNRQGWRVIVVEDRAVRAALGELCKPVWGEYIAQASLGETPFSVVSQTAADLEAARADPPPTPLLERLEDAPAFLVVAVDLSVLAVSDRDLERHSIVGGASIYPFCQNILLAARARGLGGVLTTFLSRVEEAARPMLGIPDTHGIAAMIVLGHPVQQPTRLNRNPVEQFATVDRFDGDPLA